MEEQDFQADESQNDVAETVLRVDSKERVALDLFKLIYEEATDMPEELDRKDLLTLYNQCYNAVFGVDPDDIL